LRKFFELQTMEEPSTKSSAKVLREFRKTNLYNEDFIKSLEKGLKESRYFSKSS